MKTPELKYGWFRSLIFVLALIAVIIVSGVLADWIIFKVSGKLPEGISLLSREYIHLLIIYQATILVGITVLTLVFRKLVDKKQLISLGFQNFRRTRDLLLGTGIGFLLIAAGFLILYVSGILTIEKVLPDCRYLAGTLILCLMISWIEELSFRGYLLNNLMDSFSPYNALLISSFLFAAFHLLNPGMSLVPFINLFLTGILLGIVFIHTKTIWFALSLHFSWNFVQGPVFGFPVSGLEMDGLIRQGRVEENIVSGGVFGFEGSLVSTVLVISCILVLDRYYNKTVNKPLDKND